MCGILGYSGKKNYNFNKIQTLALCNSYERGGDATGFYTPTTGIIKDVYKAHDFINKGLSDKLKPDNIIIGHLRKTSVGQNTSYNAHPFENNGVIVCHNGTLRNYINLALDNGIKGVDYNTDSQVLAKVIAKNLEEQENSDDILDIFYEYEGSAAVLYYDSNTDTMYAYRDNERPLYYGVVSGGLYISSLSYPLEIIGCKSIKQFSENILYTIKEGKIIKSQSKKINTFYRRGILSDLRIWGGVGYKGKPNYDFTGIEQHTELASYLEGFRLKYTRPTIRPKNSNTNEFVGAMTKDRRYEIKGCSGAYLVVADDNNDVKKIFYGDFDIENVFPVIGRYCTIHNSLVDFEKNTIAVHGDVIKVISYNFKADTFRGTILKSGETFSIPISSFLPYSEKEYKKIVEDLGEDAYPIINSFTETIEVIEEDDLPFDCEDECDGADGANWIHFDLVENFLDFITNRLDTIMDKHQKNEEIKHDLDDLYSVCIDNYNKSKFENLTNQEKS